VSGDYYDFFKEGGGPGAAGGGATRIGIAVADVSGHGIPAAILMSVIHAGLRTPASVTPASAPAPAILTAPGERLTFLNDLLFTSTDESHFATMFLGVYDTGTRRLRYASGGHPLPILLRASGAVERLTQGGIPLGMIPGFVYGELETALGPGDILVVYTDGVTEAVRGDEELGDDRLIEVITRARGASGAAIAGAIVDAVREWGGRADFEDDVTAVVLRVLEIR
jgi:sigma-B regulation protein RsbU (phosphoserine phosphatase)